MNVRLGISGPFVPRDPRLLDGAFAEEVRSHGASTIVTHLVAPVDPLAARRAGRALREHGVGVVQMAGIDLDLLTDSRSKLRHERQRLLHACSIAGELGAEMLLSGCGSYHPTHRYGPARENFGGAARHQLVANLRQLAGTLEQEGVLLALEGHALTTLCDPPTCRALVEEVGSPSVRMNIDPVNYLVDPRALMESRAALTAIFAHLAPVAAPAVHVKDSAIGAGLVLHVEEVCPGSGLLDFTALLELCATLTEGTALVVEHLPAELVPRAMAFMRAQIAAQDRLGLPSSARA